MKKVQNIMLMSWLLLLTLIISSMMAFATPNGDKRGNQMAGITESEVNIAYYIDNGLEQSYRFYYSLYVRYIKQMHFFKEHYTFYFDKYEVVPSTEAIGEYQPATGTIEGYALKTNLTQVGKYYVKIKGYYHKNPEVAHIQTVKIDVKQENDTCGTVYGSVFFSSDLPFPEEREGEKVTVLFTRLGAAEYDSATTPAELIGKHYFFVKTDTAEQFSMKIPAGDYSVRYLCPELNVDVYDNWMGEHIIFSVICGEETRVNPFLIVPDPEQTNTSSEITINMNAGGDNVLLYADAFEEIVNRNLLPMITDSAMLSSSFNINKRTAFEAIGDYMPVPVNMTIPNKVFFKIDGPGHYYFKLNGYPVTNDGIIHRSHTLTVKVNVEPPKPLCGTVKGRFVFPETVPADIKANTKFKVVLTDNTNPASSEMLNYPQFEGLFYFTGETNDELNFSISVPAGEYKMQHISTLLGIVKLTVANGEVILHTTCESETNIGDIVIDAVKITDTNRIASIQGLLRVNDSADIDEVSIFAVPTDNNSLKQLLPEIKYYAEKTNIKTNSANWKIQLPKGEYILYGQLRDTTIGGMSVYADTVGSGNYLLDFRFPKTEDVSRFRIKARVYDANTNEGLRSSITLIPVGIGVENLSPVELPTNSNTENYAIFIVPQSFVDRFGDNPIIVKLLASSSADIKPQYYNSVYTLAEAQEIVLNDNYDTNTVYDFPMEAVPTPPQAPNYKHRIFGTLKNGEEPVAGLINLIKKPEANQTNYKFFNAPTADNAYFEFKDVKPGRYILFAVPLQGQVMPGFYREGNVASSIWEEATEIVIAENATDTIVKQCNIALAPIETNNGSGKISGTVSGNNSNGKVVAGIASNGERLSSAFMSVFDENGNAVRNCNTDKKGQFCFNNLLPGTYKVGASIYGYKSLIQTITIGTDGKDNNYDGIQFALEPAISKVQDANEVSVYPNPAKAIININFQAQAGNATISISDALGNRVFSNNIATIDGVNNYNYNTQSMPNGLYLITIQLDNGKTISTLLTIVK